MIELKGKYNTAKVFTEVIEETAIGQIIELCNQKFIAGETIRIMPDVHAGAGCTIGTTMTITDKIVPNLVGVDIGCVDKDTEFLTPYGWKKISEFKKNDMVAVYNLYNDTTFFEYPKNYIKLREEEFIKIKTKYGIDQMLSKEHTCLLRKGKHNRVSSVDKAYTISALDLYNKHQALKLGVRDNFVCNIPNLEIEGGLELTDEEIRLIVMYAADGITKHSSDLLSVQFRKQRKIERCKELLTKAGIAYEEVVYGNGTTKISFRFKYDYKRVSSLWGCNRKQLKVVCEEVMHWDGNEDSMQYTSIYKDDVDFIQYAFACNNKRTSIDFDAREGKECWRVSIASCTPRVQPAGSPKTNMEIVKSIDGFKYCFTTSTGFWIMRRNGCICITGNCGMHVTKLKDKHIEPQKLDKVIREFVPSGFSVRSGVHEYAKYVNLNNLRCIKGVNNLARIYQSLGTLGGGNHFIEVNKDSEGNLYLVIHSGSRNLGKQVAEYYQNLAIEKLSSNLEEQKALIAKLKAEGRQSEIEAELKKLKRPVINKALAYVDGKDFEDYIHDMEITQNFAYWNRKAIAQVILKEMKLKAEDDFTTIHNYIETDNMILRKGAVSAQAGEILLIPINMRDGSLLCRGKGNADWNYSAPHGAGRLMSRSAAKESFTVNEFKKQMDGIYTTSVGQSTLDECPMAYKGIDDIVNNIGDTVDILDILKPIYNYKAN